MAEVEQGKTSTNEADKGGSAGLHTPRTLVRVKRRRDQEPVEILEMVSSAKKSKTDAKDNSVVIFSFATTIEGKDQEEEKNLLKKAIDMAKERVKKKGPKVGEGDPSIRLKARKELKLNVEKNRYELLRQKRNIELGDESTVQVLDVVSYGNKKAKSDISCNGLAMEREVVENSDDFVYDLYELRGEDPLNTLDDDFFSQVKHIEGRGLDDFIHENYREDDEDIFDEDSDSNDEGNWKNDYPDEEEYAHYEVDEELSDIDIENMRIRDDDDEGDFVYDREDFDDEDGDHSGLVFTRSMNRVADMHGSSYARYKQKLLKKMMAEEENDDDLDDYDSDEQ